MEGGENKTDWETDPKSGKLRKKKYEGANLTLNLFLFLKLFQNFKKHFLVKSILLRNLFII